VFGRDHATGEARRLIGMAEQDVNLGRFLTVEETLRYHGGYYGMERATARQRAREIDGRLRPAREGGGARPEAVPRPLFYVASAVRCGFLGASEVSVVLAFGVTAALAAAMVAWSSWLFATKRKLKA
jgi:hypothetical protein